MQYPMFKVHIALEPALKNITAVLKSGYLNEGIQVRELENSLSDFLGVRNLVLVNSCTSALTIAYRLSGASKNNSIVSTPMTCIATNAPIKNLGARIIWADVEPLTGNIDPQQIESSIRKDTKAIVSVSWAGSPPDLEKIDKIARKYSIVHIHDGAHAFGARLKGRPISDYADFTCFSFQAIKHFTTGDGGALICRDPKNYELAKKLKWFGYDRDGHKDENGEWKGQRWAADVLEGEIGYKFNMNNLAAAIGMAQIPHAADILSKHKRNAEIYKSYFSKTDRIACCSQVTGSESSYWVFTTLLKDPEVNRDLLLQKLNSIGIGAGLVHVPNDLYSAFSQSKTSLKGTRFFADRQISLPCGWWLSERDCSKIAKNLLNLLTY